MQDKVLNNNLTLEFRKILGSNFFLTAKEDLIVYEYDGSIDKNFPLAVALPKTADQVAKTIKLAKINGISVMPRGAATSLSGGAIPLGKSISISLSRMNKIVEINSENKTATVQPGVVNLDLSNAARKKGMIFAPDPSSQKVCTLGGNIAENAGGPHCLAVGSTTNHVIGIEVVTAEGEIIWLGGNNNEYPGYDLRSMFVGSEGTLGIATKIIVRLVAVPKAVKTIVVSFPKMDEACDTTSEIIGAGIIPAALEIMDRVTLDAVEPVYHPGFSQDTHAVLLVETEGNEDEVEKQMEEITLICNKNGATEIRTAKNEEERAELWKTRKDAIGAMGTLAPNYYLVDGVVPRTKLKDMMNKISSVASELDLVIANVFHAGDGNLHPCILFDERKKGDVEKVIRAGGLILKMCVDSGGALSGEHGIGVEKQAYMPWVFNDDDLNAMKKISIVFGSENDTMNPKKIFPQDELLHGKSFGAQGGIIISKTSDQGTI